MPTFVLVPGNSLSGAIYDKLIPLLPAGEKHIFELTGPRNPSMTPLEQYGIPSQAERLADFLIDNDLRDVVLIGMSFGGHVGAHALSRIADRLRVFITMGAPPLTFPPDMSGFRQREEFPLFFKPELTEEEAMTLASIASPRSATQVAGMMRDTSPAFRSAAAELVGSAGWSDEVAIFRQHLCPVVFLSSLHDPLVSSGWLRDKAADLSIPFIGIQSDSHIPMLDDPQAFANGVTEALGLVDEKRLA